MTRAISWIVTDKEERTRFNEALQRYVQRVTGDINQI